MYRICVAPLRYTPYTQQVPSAPHPAPAPTAPLRAARISPVSSSGTQSAAGSTSTPPPVYRPYSSMAQRTVATAPPVYTPSSFSAQKYSSPAPPPAYRPAQSSGILRKVIPVPPVYVPFNKAAAQGKTLPTPPPVYRPGNLSAAQSRLAPAPWAGGSNALSPKLTSRLPQRNPAAPSVRAPDYLAPRSSLPAVQLKPTPPLAAKASPRPAAYRPSAPASMHGMARVVQTRAARPSTQPSQTPPALASALVPNVVQPMHGKQVSPRTEPIPIVTLDPHRSEFEQLYGMPAPSALAYYDELTERMRQAIHIDSDLMNPSSGARFPKEIQDEYWDTLERHRGLHVGSVPALKEGWVEIHHGYTGSKVGGALYTHLRSGFKPVLDGSDVDFGSCEFVRRYPEVHHLLYKAIRPEYATEDWNLMVATRGNSKQQGQHEGIFHKLSAAKMGGIYTTLVPAAERLLESWAEHTPSLYPSWTPQPSLFAPVVAEWSSSHYAPPTPVLFAPTLVYPRQCEAITMSRKQCSRQIYSGTKCHQHILS